MAGSTTTSGGTSDAAAFTFDSPLSLCVSCCTDSFSFGTASVDSFESIFSGGFASSVALVLVEVVVVVSSRVNDV